MVALFRHVDVARAVDREAVWQEEASGTPGAIRGAELKRCAGEYRDLARGRDLADQEILRVGNVDIASRVHASNT